MMTRCMHALITTPWGFDLPSSNNRSPLQVGARDYEAASQYLLEEARSIQTLAASRDDLHVEVSPASSMDIPASNAGWPAWEVLCPWCMRASG